MMFYQFTLQHQNRMYKNIQLQNKSEITIN